MARKTRAEQKHEKATQYGIAYANQFCEDWNTYGTDWFPKGKQSIAGMAGRLAKVGLYSDWVFGGRAQNPTLEDQQVCQDAAIRRCQELLGSN